MELKRLLVLASGRGSNFAAIADAIEQKRISRAQIVGLLSNKKKAPAIEIAKSKNIPTYVIESKHFKKDGRFDRASYEVNLLAQINELNPDWIILAGYMLVLGKEIIEEYRGKILNIHPSLLPKFKGVNAQKQALDAGEKETGCTVHFVSEELDSGEIILQNRISILPEDTEETLVSRLLKVEHETYVQALQKLIN